MRVFIALATAGSVARAASVVTVGAAMGGLQSSTERRSDGSTYREIDSSKRHYRAILNNPEGLRGAAP
ncbi:hypothetical protein GCM10018963_02530 [Saccharothrix longispora]